MSGSGSAFALVTRYLSGKALVPGTVVANKALIPDSNKDLATLRNLTVSGNLVIGSNTISPTELGYLDGLTAGTVAASKAVVVDANKDAADFRNLSGTNLKAGKDAVAGSVVIFPTTTAKGSAKITVSDQTGNTQNTLNFTGAGQATVYTLPDPGTTAATILLSVGTQGIAATAGTMTRTGQEYNLGGSPKVGGTAGWVVNGAANFFEATIPASQSASKLVVPIFGLKVGWVITGFRVVAQIESAGNTVTLDGDLRYQANVAADPTDNSIGTMTQVSVVADTASSQTKTGLSHTVVSSNSYYLLLTATTGASTDIRYLGTWITVTEA
jgi:hypothetical protein